MNRRFVPLNEKIKYLRLVSGKTQSEIAKELCVERSSISNYELGIREPDVLTLKRMAEIFDVDAGYFLGNGNLTTLMNETDKEECSKMLGKIRSVNSTINTERMSLTSRVALHSFHEYLNFCDNRAKKKKRSGER